MTSLKTKIIQISVLVESDDFKLSDLEEITTLVVATLSGTEKYKNTALTKIDLRVVNEFNRTHVSKSVKLEISSD